MARSTGKRRYGHPALNGVLPEPWLPLKKGQTLVNNDNHRAHREPGDEAVVLTLRKRYSGAPRRAARGPSEDGHAPATTLAGLDGGSVGVGADPSAVIDPWQDPAATARGGRQREVRVLSHRLSYDHASGVIVLPDEEWGEEGSESEEDYGTAGDGLERSVTESMLDAEGAGDGVAGGSAAGGSAASGAGGGGPLGRLSRYGTYFHHPERRKQSVPGAFPGR